MLNFNFTFAYIMKKTTINILIASMIATFLGLMALQIRYVSINAEMIENQFNESVERSLFQTAILVEENEALQYLGDILETPRYKSTSTTLLNSSSLSKIDSVSKNLKSTNSTNPDNFFYAISCMS